MLSVVDRLDGLIHFEVGFGFETNKDQHRHNQHNTFLSEKNKNDRVGNQ